MVRWGLWGCCGVTLGAWAWFTSSQSHSMARVGTDLKDYPAPLLWAGMPPKLVFWGRNWHFSYRRCGFWSVAVFLTVSLLETGSVWEA